MTEAQPPQFEAITPEQKVEIEALQLGPEAESVIRSFGEQAIEGAYGDVSPEVPVDAGASIEEQMIQGAPGEEVQPDSDPETQEADTSAALDKLLEDSGISEVLTRYNTLRASLEDGTRTDMMLVDHAEQELQHLSQLVRMAAEQGPWAGNYLANHPSLVQNIRHLGESFVGYRMKSQTNNDERGDAMSRFNRDVDEAGENIASGIRSIESEDAQKVARTVDDVRESMQVAARRSGNNGADKTNAWLQVTNLLDQVAYDSHISVDDVMQVAQRALQTVQGISDMTRADLRDVSFLDEQMDSMRRIVSK